MLNRLNFERCGQLECHRVFKAMGIGAMLGEHAKRGGA